MYLSKYYYSALAALQRWDNQAQGDNRSRNKRQRSDEAIFILWPLQQSVLCLYFVFVQAQVTRVIICDLFSKRKNTNNKIFRARTLRLLGLGLSFSPSGASTLPHINEPLPGVRSIG